MLIYSHGGYILNQFQQILCWSEIQNNLLVTFLQSLIKTYQLLSEPWTITKVYQQKTPKNHNKPILPNQFIIINNKWFWKNNSINWV